MLRGVLGVVALAGLMGCSEPSEPVAQDAVFDPIYRGIETQLLDGDLVRFLVEMQGARDSADIETYARCAAAQYTLIRGYGFARHVRTRVAEEGSLWRADAVYTISPALPRGATTIDAEVVVDDCTARGIPTV